MSLILFCQYCGKELVRSKSEDNWGFSKRKFCSRSCSAKFRNKDKDGKKVVNSQREKALERYYENPNRCLYCDEVIMVKENASVWDAQIKKYCNSSCQNKHLNPLRRQKTAVCKSCGKTYERYRTKGGVWSCSKNCPDCQKLGYGRTIEFMHKNKAQVYNEYSSTYSARNAIAQNAQVVYKNNGGTCCCHLCYYDKHIEICHIKPVSEFDHLALMQEINIISNLIGLCPNCHWEFDHGALDEPQLQKIKDYQSKS